MKTILTRTAILLGALLFILVAMVLSRAALLSPGGSPVTAHHVELEREDERIARFAEALTIPTTSPTPEHPQLDSFQQLHQRLEGWFPRVHAKARREVINDATLLFTLEGSQPDLPAVVFLAHQDVVPVEPGTEDDWTHPPFAGTVADGFVWGRGALDNKHNLMALMEALERQLERGEAPRHTMHLIFGHDEEVGGAQGALAVAQRFKDQNVALAAVYDEGLIIADGIVPGIDGPIALIGITEKGYVTLGVTATAEGGHASMPPNQLAAVKLARALGRLDEHPMRAAIDGPTRMMFDVAAPHMAFGM